MGDNRSKKQRGVSAIFTLLIVAALAYGALQAWKLYHRYDVDRKYDFAMLQCENYGGRKGAIPILTEGVYDHRRRSAPPNIFDRASIYISNGLRYVEFSRDVIRLSPSEGFWLGGPYYNMGKRDLYLYYRVYVSDWSDPLCEPYKSTLKDGDGPFHSLDLADNQCIAVMGFDDPRLIEAPYELVVSDRVVDEGVPVEWNNLEVIERSSGIVVASLNTFSHCFTKTVRNNSDGFNYCSGIYENPKVRPKCPGDSKGISLGIRTFEKNAFAFEREPS